MQKILVTGARSGIINKVIKKLIFDYEIYLTVHTESQLKIVKKKYQHLKNIKCFKLDINDKKDLKKLETLDIDILVSNAAIGASGSIAEIDMNKVRQNFETNVFSNFEVVQIVLKNMIKKGKGRIVMISSLAGTIPIPFLGSYCATKASINKLTEALNLELKLLDAKIDICLIKPGLYKTGFNKLLFDKKYDWMEYNSYFKKQIELIKKTENIYLALFERKKLDSIVKKITKAITSKKPHFIYSAPFSHKIAAKIYGLFR